MAQVPVKVAYNGVKRRVSVSSTINFETLQNTLCDMFPVTRPFSITYIDNDNDVVALSSDAELSELFRLVDKNLISTIIMTLHDGENPPPAPENPPQPEHAEFHPHGPHHHHHHPHGPPPHHRGYGHGGDHWQHRRRRHGRGWEGRRGGAAFEQTSEFAHFMPQLMRMFSSMGGPAGPFGSMIGGFMPLLHSMPEISEDIRSAFAEVRSSASGSNIDHQEAFKLVKRVFPLLCKSLADAFEASSSSETESPVLPTETIDSIVNQVQSELQNGPLSESLVSSIVQLLRKILTDSAMMSIISKLPLRQMESGLENIDLESCNFYEADNANNNESSHDPFKDLPTLCKDQKVPKAPLNEGDHGPQVLFLQKLLTDLGYMHKYMYARRAGFYGNRTKQAVEKFQSEFNLESSVLKGVYDATTAATLESVMDGKTDTDSSGAGPSSTVPNPEVQA